MVIGLNFRTAPVAIRERFWISEPRRYEALLHLGRSEGIQEVIVLATCNRTEFLLWADDASLAANSVLRFLSAECGLKLCEWSHFYRLLDEGALLHVFRVASSLDSMVIGEPQIIAQVKGAWQQAQNVGTSGRFLDSVMQKALTVSKRVRNETTIGNSAVSIPYAAVETARALFGSIEGRKVLLVGAGKMSELSARYLIKNGAKSVHVVNRTFEHSVQLAGKLGGTAAPFEERRQHLLEADILISSTSCPHTVLGREEAEALARDRNRRPMCLVDIAVPRDIDPAVRQVEGMFLYDIDDLERAVERNTSDRKAAAAEAEKIVVAEAAGFTRRLVAERVVPTIVALREHLDQICRQELQSYFQEFGPFTKDQQELFEAVAARITKRISGSMARELKELPEKVEQEQMTAAVQRLFHLQKPETALSGTRS
jgi:glutamyl-tRNA reductase